MADFKGWALQYVLADDELTRQDAVAKTYAGECRTPHRPQGNVARLTFANTALHCSGPEALSSASVKSTAILGWVQSIDPWMPAALSSTGAPQNDDAGGESEFDVIARAKGVLSHGPCALHVRITDWWFYRPPAGNEMFPISSGLSCRHTLDGG